MRNKQVKANEIMFPRFGDIMTPLSREWKTRKCELKGAVPEDLLSCFRVLNKCKNKFDRLVNEMFYIK